MSLKPLEMVHQLKETGFASPQAECIVKQVMVAIQDSDLVTKTFLTVELAQLEARLEKNIAAEIARLERNMFQLEKNFSDKFSQLEKNVTDEIAQLERNTNDGFSQLEKKTDDRSSQLEKKVDDGFSRLERKISRIEIRWIKWMIGTQLCFFSLTTGPILGLIYFLHSK